MILVAIADNSHTCFGVVEDGEITRTWRISTDPRRTGDEWAVLLSSLVGSRLELITGACVASTVPRVLQAWRQMLAGPFAQLHSVVVEAGVKTGLAIHTDNPREVGTDRICNALAAVERFGGPCVVVDFKGTATTYDVIDAAGHYVGGAITPGLELAVDALGDRAALLRRVELARPRSAIAKNTTEALQSGLLFGTAAQVDGLVARLIAELGDSGEDSRVVSTGYLADLVTGECSSFTDSDPHLTLRGLSSVFDRNS
ncbi:type III pantothenate kinase [soil metagenome]